MNLEEVTGIIVNETNYGETSKILNVITKEKGLISVMAKGCKNLKSPLRSVSSKLTYGTFIIYYKENKISTLKEISVLDNFKNLKKDITSISYAAYMLELSEGVIKQNNDPRIFDLLIQSLKKIDESFDPLVIMNILELKYLEFLGVMPIIDSCAIGILLGFPISQLFQSFIKPTTRSFPHFIYEFAWRQDIRKN